MAQTAFASPPALATIKARADRMFKVTVCLRPFRAAGPRIEAHAWVEPPSASAPAEEAFAPIFHSGDS